MVDLSPAAQQSSDGMALYPEVERFRLARAIERRATTDRSDHGAETRAAVERLDRKLRTGVPLREDVPRGYHLDITV